MTTHYVWQGGPNGNGTSPADTRRTIPNGSSGDKVLFKRGATFALGSQLSINTADLYWGTFGTGDLPVISSTATNFGAISVDNSGTWTVENIEFRNFLNYATNGAVINLAVNATSGRASSLVVRGCKFKHTAYNAIRANGTNTATAAAVVKVLGCEFDDIGEDCIFGGVLDLEVGYNRMVRMSTRTLTGDGVGFINADPNKVWIHHNYIDHSAVDAKQCIIIDITNPGSGLSIIEDNILIGYGSTTIAPSLHNVIISDPVTKIRRNIIYAYGIACGINTDDDEVTDNLIFVGNTNGLGPPVAVVADGKFHRNTIVGLGSLTAGTAAVVMGTGASSDASIRGNAFINFPVGIQSNVVGVNPTTSHNAFWRVTTPRLGSSGAFAGDSDVTDDPQSFQHSGIRSLEFT